MWVVWGLVACVVFLFGVRWWVVWRQSADDRRMADYLREMDVQRDEDDEVW